MNVFQFVVCSAVDMFTEYNMAESNVVEFKMGVMSELTQIDFAFMLLVCGLECSSQNAFMSLVCGLKCSSQNAFM